MLRRRRRRVIVIPLFPELDPSGFFLILNFLLRAFGEPSKRRAEYPLASVRESALHRFGCQFVQCSGPSVVD